MLELFAIPVLIKAADFLFEEGRKILQERRERRQAELKANTSLAASNSDTDPGKSDAFTREDKDVIQTKDDLLHQQIDQMLLNRYKRKIRHELDLLETYTQQYYWAKEQFAKYGIDAPPITRFRLQDAEDNIVATMKDLQESVSLVSGKEVIISELQDD
jgi:hypothetical protein